MASYHFEVKTISRSSNVTPIAKFEYINREGSYKNLNKKLPEKKFDYINREYVELSKERTEKIDSKLDYINREGNYRNTDESEELQYKESGSMPSWAQDDPREFWRAAEIYERSNGTVFRELIFALPNELNLDQQKEMIAEFLQKNIPDNTYSYSIHKNPATLAPDIEQPHVHLIFSERLNDGIERERSKYFSRYNSKNPENGGAKKDRKWAGTYQERKENLLNLRKSFADIQNKYLEKYNHDVRVDHRTLEAQKEAALIAGDNLKARELDRPAETKLGPKVTRLMIKALQEHRKKFKKKYPQEVYAKDLQEDYILDNQDKKIYPKVTYNYSVRQIRRLTKQIESEYERKGHDNFSGRQENIYTYETDTFVLPTEISIANMQLVINDIDKKIYDLDQKVKLLKERKIELAPDVKTEIDAERIARSRVLGKDVKELTSFKEMLNQKTAEYEMLYQKHASKPKPLIFNLKAKSGYDETEKMLKNMKSDINMMQLELDVKNRTYFDKSNIKEVKYAIEQIKENILYLNKPFRDEFHNVGREIQRLESIIGQCRKSQKNLARQLNILVKQDTPLSKQISQDMSITIKSTLSRLNALCKVGNDNGRAGFGQARLYTDEDELDKKRGRSV